MKYINEYNKLSLNLFDGDKTFQQVTQISTFKNC